MTAVLLVLVVLPVLVGIIVFVTVVVASGVLVRSPRRPAAAGREGTGEQP